MTIRWVNLWHTTCKQFRKYRNLHYNNENGPNAITWYDQLTRFRSVQFGMADVATAFWRASTVAQGDLSSPRACHLSAVTAWRLAVTASVKFDNGYSMKICRENKNFVKVTDNIRTHCMETSGAMPVWQKPLRLCSERRTGPGVRRNCNEEVFKGDSKRWTQLKSKRHLNTRQTVGCGIPSSLLALPVDLGGLRSKLSWIHLTFSDTRDRPEFLPLHRQPICSNWWFQRQMLFLVGGWMLKRRRRNARCTAVAYSVLMKWRTQKILWCLVDILLSTDASARLCARRRL